MIAYFDCTRGIAGDMIIAALLDAGVDGDQLIRELEKLNLADYRVEISDTARCHIHSKQFKVIVTGEQKEHRHLGRIIDIIEKSELSETVKSRACAVFERLGRAEAQVHNIDISKVHFHEVGAIDSIIDIVGACICFELMGIDEIFYSKIAVGSGTVKCAHGILPVPAPATVKLLEGKRVYAGPGDGELTTPTGSAIITTVGTQKIDLPELELSAVGYGAGSRDSAEYPNVLRVFIGNKNTDNRLETDEISVISFNIDDSTAEHTGLLVEQLLASGVLDVIQVPAYMKKSRAGIKIEVLTKIADEHKIAEMILSQGTSFGVRISHQYRYKLKRKIVRIELPEGNVSVKLGLLGEKLVQIAPEFEDCKRIAEINGRNFREVYACALELARQAHYNE